MKFGKLQGIKLSKEELNKEYEDYLDDAFLAGFADDYEEALKIFDKAIYLFSTKSDDPDVTWGLYLMKGLTLSKLDRFREALIAYEECIKIDKKDPESWSGKADALHDLGKHKEALSAIEKSIQFSDKEDLADYLYDKGDYLSHLGRYEEALQVCNEMLKIKPKDPDFLYSKATVLSDLDKHNEALKTCEEGLDIDPNDEDLLIHKGVILMDLDRNKEALSLFEQAIKINPTEELTWYNKACVLSILNKKDEALDALVVATSIEPENLKDSEDEEDFDNIRKTEKFKRMLSQEI